MSMNIILATHNLSKLKEFRTMASDYPVKILGLRDIGYEQEIEETGASFDENAMLKAKTVYNSVNDLVIADDSGLCVDALDGAPGIYSARYAGENGKNEDRIARLLHELHGVDEPDRSAVFRCSLVAIYRDGQTKTFHGYCHGTIIREPRGENGFGYDPVFVPDGDRRTLAEMSEQEKHAISHRGNAVRLFLRDLFDNGLLTED